VSACESLRPGTSVVVVSSWNITRIISYITMHATCQMYFCDNELYSSTSTWYFICYISSSRTNSLFTVLWIWSFEGVEFHHVNHYFPLTMLYLPNMLTLLVWLITNTLSLPLTQSWKCGLCSLFVATYYSCIAQLCYIEPSEGAWKDFRASTSQYSVHHWMEVPSAVHRCRIWEKIPQFK